MRHIEQHEKLYEALQGVVLMRLPNLMSLLEKGLRLQWNQASIWVREDEYARFRDTNFLDNLTFIQVVVPSDMQYSIQGMVDVCGLRFYPEIGSMMVIMSKMIEQQLDAFNAGKHWRYKGL